MAGVPGSSFLALSATAAALGFFPVAGVALLLGADRLMDSMRVVVNLLGNCVATFVVAKWEKQFDRDAMVRAFNGEIVDEDDAIALDQEEEFREAEAQRLREGHAASPRFLGEAAQETPDRDLEPQGSYTK
jgi:aerobic C4-dicarboxylate transport protein